MSNKVLFLIVSLGLVSMPEAVGQCTGKGSVGCLLNDIFAAGKVSSTTHNASFPTADFAGTTLTDLSTGIATQLSALPIPSTASGFIYMLDPSGAYTRSAESFGPILTERAETVGKHKFFLGFSYQPFHLTSVDGINLHNVGAVLVHQPDPALAVSCPECFHDVITTLNNFDLNISQYTAIGTYGLTNRVDVSVAIPILDVRFGVASTGTLQRIGTKNETDPKGFPIHFFGPGPSMQSSQQAINATQETFNGSRSAQGLGDVILRVKGTAVRWGDRAALAVGTDVRLPTGDESNLLGSGAIGIKPYVALSASYGRVSPHFNFGYQWSGKSVLAGDIATGYKRHLPGAFPYAAGVDVGVAKRLTLDFDVLGEELIGQSRIIRQRYTRDGVDFPDVISRREQANITNGAVGFKFNPFGSVLLYANLLFKMNDAGLRAKATPLFGITYTR